MQVSILILTLNEEANLPACLDVLSWCDDIVILDSGSSDKTVSIAQAKGARILARPFDNFASQRNWGLENGHFNHDWVLHLDADEIVTPEFVTTLLQLEPPEMIDAYNVPSKTMFFGKWLRHAGMWPSYQVRLGRRDVLRFVQVGHGQREDLLAERIDVFPEAYLHFSFSKGLAHWLQRHLRYAEDEVDQLQKSKLGSGELGVGGVTAGRRRIKALVARLPLLLRPIARFFYIYFVRLGFLDGLRGLTYAFMLAIYEGMIAVIGMDRLEKIASRDTNVASVPTGSDKNTIGVDKKARN